MSKKRLFSGIQPSGEIHIGNYLGALKNWVGLMESHEAIYCVVDYHAITIPYEPSEFPNRVMDSAAMLMAVGLDPEKCTLFVQSHVPEHTELSWILGTVINIGHLERMTQFKEKSKQHEENVNVGLFTYPVLQTSDIVLYKAGVVPVGEDQVQHVELAREIVRRFNARFGPVFPEPQEKVTAAARIMGLDGKAKMSKSLNNTIGLTDTPDEIRDKLKTAVTDENRKRRNDPGNPDICNIFTLHKHLSPPQTVDNVRVECQRAGIGCIECKASLAENMIRELSPIRERYLGITAEPARIKSALKKGADHCRAIARKTMEEVHSAMGMRRS
jgi:tryptophanyl-tRNA synthetase